MRATGLPIVLAIMLGTVGFDQPLFAQQTIAPKVVTLTRTQAPLGEILQEITTQTGLPVELVNGNPKLALDVKFDRVPFWTALEDIATKTNSRITLGKDGRQITLTTPPILRSISAVDGPFRIILQQVTSRIDLGTGTMMTEVTIECHWEPRLPVFRIDSEPTITTVTDDRGTKLTVTPNKAKVPPRGSHYTTVVRIPNVPRSTTKLTQLSGSFQVTAAEKMLSFRFTDLLAATPQTQDQTGVKVTLLPIKKVTGRWDVPVELNYPPTKIEFESYESALWLTENRLQLISPTGQTYAPVNDDTRESPTKAFVTYRYLDTAKGPPFADRKGWSVLYDTPSPLVEFRINFDLRDVPLP